MIIHQLKSAKGQLKNGVTIFKLFEVLNGVFRLLLKNGMLYNNPMLNLKIFFSIGTDKCRKFKNVKVLRLLGGTIDLIMEIARDDIKWTKMPNYKIHSYIFILYLTAQLTSFFIKLICNRKVTFFSMHPKVIGKFKISKEIMREFSRDLSTGDIGACGIGFTYYRCKCCRQKYITT